MRTRLRPARLHLARFRACRVLSVIVLGCVLGSFPGSPLLAVDQPPVPGTEVIRSQIQAEIQRQQEAQKQLSLKQAAMQVAEGRVNELKKQVDDATKRLETEKADVARIQQETAALDAQVVSLNDLLKKHEEADRLQKDAAAANTRLEAIVAARGKLESEMSALRKASVEHQSKAVESEQKVQSLEATRADLTKAATEAKTAFDAAQQQSAAADTALATATAALTTLTTGLTAEQQRLDAATAASGKIAESVAALQKSLEGLKESAKSTGVNSDEAVNALTAAINELVPLQKNSATLIQQVTARRDALNPQVETAKAEAEKKKAEQAAMAAALAKAAETQKMADEKIVSLNQQQEMLKKVAMEAQGQQQALTAQIQALDPSIQKLNAEIQMVRSETVAQQKMAEAALEPLGRFVSFSRHVAPVFAKRCVACHNTRSPGGRLNLDSFAALNKGGESGAAVLAHKAGDSLLLTMVQDGSMPKDADPLTKEEIAVIQKWIEVGAPLDAGLLANAELFDVIPEASQPLPPASYRVAIPVTATAFSPDGAFVATSGYHEVLLWKTDDGSLVRRISNVAERVYDVEFSRDGQSVVVAAGTPGQLGEVKLFSMADGSLTRTLVRAKDAVFAVSYSPDGTQLASAGADRSIVVVTVADGQVVTKIEDHADWVMDVNWSPDGLRLVSSSRDKTSKVFDAKTGDPQITFSGHGEPVYSAAFLADSKTVVSGAGDKRLRVWNTADGKELRAITGFGGDVFRVVVAAGDRIFSASADKNVREHAAADGKLIRTLAGHGDWVYTLAFSSARNLIVTGSYDGEIRVWNSEDGAMQTSFIAIPKETPASNVTAAVQ